MIIECSIIYFMYLNLHNKSKLLNILEEDLFNDFTNKELKVLNGYYLWRRNLSVIRSKKRNSTRSLAFVTLKDC